MKAYIGILAVMGLMGCATTRTLTNETAAQVCYQSQAACKQQWLSQERGTVEWVRAVKAYCGMHFDDSVVACEQGLNFAYTEGYYPQACAGYTKVCHDYPKTVSCEMKVVACKAAESAPLERQLNADRAERALERQRQGMQDTANHLQRWSEQDRQPASIKVKIVE